MPDGAIEIVIRNMDELEKKLDDVGNASYMEGAMTAALSLLKDDAAEYPPENIANIPYQRRWYERNYGPKWMRRDGTVGGIAASEMLGKSWTTRVKNRGLLGVLGNKASYGPFVQDKERQAGFHRAREMT